MLPSRFRGAAGGAQRQQLGMGLPRDTTPS